MKLEPFKLERIMSEWQNEVEVDLSPSGVDAMRLDELVSPEELEEIHRNVKLRFVQTNGPVPLREAILRQYPGAGIDNVLVTNGSSEALMIMLWKHCEPGFELIEFSPTYSLVGGLARSLGATVRTVPLVEERGWAPDLDALEASVTSETRMIYVCNPSNPTGAILTVDEMDAIVRAAERVGAWIVADEIYHGGELDGRPTPSFWGSYDKLLVTASLSKSYGLAGLRLGWLVGPVDEITAIWPYHDYTTTTATALSVELARLALEPERESRIFARTREISNANYELLDAWISRHPGLLSLVPTKIAGLAFFGYDLDVPSEDLAKRLIRDKGVLLAPGGYFGAERHFRIGYSVPQAQLAAGLERLEGAFVTYDSAG